MWNYSFFNEEVGTFEEELPILIAIGSKFIAPDGLTYIVVEWDYDDELWIVCEQAEEAIDEQAILREAKLNQITYENTNAGRHKGQD